jgi:hypothetical protein
MVGDDDHTTQVRFVKTSIDGFTTVAVKRRQNPSLRRATNESCHHPDVST